MATWHQQQARTKLYHDTKWTVVHNPPNQGCSLSTFATEACAKAAMEKWEAAGQTHLYILPPARTPNKWR